MISGLEHGFTIQERPGSAASAAHRLEFNLRVRGDLRAEIAAEGEAVRFVDATGASVVNYARLKVWDADGQILPARFAAQRTNRSLTKAVQSAFRWTTGGRATRLRWTQLPSRPI